MKLLALFDIVTVPPPPRVTFPSSTNSVLEPAEPSVIVPALLMLLPKTFRTMPLLIVRPSAAWLNVRLPTWALPRSSCTAALAVPMVTSTVLLLGTPALQLPALLQWMPSPLPVQLSDVLGGFTALAARCTGAAAVSAMALDRGRSESWRFALERLCPNMRLEKAKSATRTQNKLVRLATRAEIGRIGSSLCEKNRF